MAFKSIYKKIWFTSVLPAGNRSAVVERFCFTYFHRLKFSFATIHSLTYKTFGPCCMMQSLCLFCDAVFFCYIMMLSCCQVCWLLSRPHYRRVQHDNWPNVSQLMVTHCTLWKPKSGDHGWQAGAHRQKLNCPSAQQTPSCVWKQLLV